MRPCFFTKSVKFRSFEVFLVPFESSRRDLESEHGFEACSLKNKGKIKERSWIFILPGVKKVEKKLKFERIRSNFGLRRSGWVEMDAGGWPGPFFRLPGLNNFEKNHFFCRFSRGFSQKRAEATYKRLVPISLSGSKRSKIPESLTTLIFVDQIARQ